MHLEKIHQDSQPFADMEIGGDKEDGAEQLRESAVETVE